MTFRFTTEYVEMIHDEVVAQNLWPGSEPVHSGEYRDLGLLDSAVSRPFQTFDGVDVYPSLYGKAAALFHSLTCNHCFHNGNKRTALIALDLFLTANSVFLAASNGDVYNLATTTAAHNERGITADQAFSAVFGFINENAVPFNVIKTQESENPEISRNFYRRIREMQQQIRTHPLNCRTTGPTNR